MEAVPGVVLPGPGARGGVGAAGAVVVAVAAVVAVVGAPVGAAVTLLPGSLIVVDGGLLDAGGEEDRGEGREGEQSHGTSG